MLLSQKAGRALGLITTAATFWAWGSAPGQAALITLETALDGFQEVDDAGNPGQGDPDGFGTALVVIDDEALTIDWNFTFGNIELPLILAHIHQAPAGVAGPSWSISRHSRRARTCSIPIWPMSWRTRPGSM